MITYLTQHAGQYLIIGKSVDVKPDSIADSIFIETDTGKIYKPDGSSGWTLISSMTPRAQAAATRSLNTIFQISATRDALATYSVKITTVSTIAASQEGDVILEIASNAGFTNNVQTLAIQNNGQSYALAIALQGTQPNTVPLIGFIPAGYYVRIRTVNISGTPTFAYRSGQEIQL